MNHNFAVALEAMLTSVAKEAASEAIRQFRIEEQRRKHDGEASRLLLRSHEAAEQLAISHATLERLTRSGEIPCVRLGRSIRYSTEALRDRIRQKELSGKNGQALKADTKVGTHKRLIGGSDFSAKPEHGQKIEATARRNKKSKAAPVSKSKETEPEKKQGSKKAARMGIDVESRRSSRNLQPKKEKIKPNEERRIGPFDLLLKEIGVERDALPPLTKGDLMRIADVDIPTLHGWQWNSRALPNEALNRLKDHFIQYRKGKGDSMQ